MAARENVIQCKCKINFIRNGRKERLLGFNDSIMVNATIDQNIKKFFDIAYFIFLEIGSLPSAKFTINSVLLMEALTGIKPPKKSKQVDKDSVCDFFACLGGCECSLILSKMKSLLKSLGMKIQTRYGEVIFKIIYLKENLRPYFKKMGKINSDGYIAKIEFSLGNITKNFIFYFSGIQNVIKNVVSLNYSVEYPTGILVSNAPGLDVLVSYIHKTPINVIYYTMNSDISFSIPGLVSAAAVTGLGIQQMEDGFNVKNMVKLNLRPGSGSVNEMEQALLEANKTSSDREDDDNDNDNVQKDEDKIMEYTECCICTCDQSDLPPPEKKSARLMHEYAIQLNCSHTICVLCYGKMVIKYRTFSVKCPTCRSEHKWEGLQFDCKADIQEYLKENFPEWQVLTHVPLEDKIELEKNRKINMDDMLYAFESNDYLTPGISNPNINTFADVDLPMPDSFVPVNQMMQNHQMMQRQMIYEGGRMGAMGLNDQYGSF